MIEGRKSCFNKLWHCIWFCFIKSTKNIRDKAKTYKKKLILLINNQNSINIHLPEDIQTALNQNWDLTIIYKGQGYRRPKDQFLIKLINQVGPLWSSSANISGETTIENLEEWKKFHSTNDEIMLVETGNKPCGQASTIYDYDQKITIRKGKNQIFS